MVTGPSGQGSAGRTGSRQKNRACKTPLDRLRIFRLKRNRRQWRECVEHALEVRGVSLRFGGVRALADVSFGVNDGELFSIIGPNGAGKTSIVNCISGRYRPTEGQLTIEVLPAPLGPM